MHQSLMCLAVFSTSVQADWTIYASRAMFSCIMFMILDLCVINWLLNQEVLSKPSVPLDA